MDLNLTGKTALVGGSSQGIGLATAQVLASLGANIILLSRNENALNHVKNELPVSGDQKHQVLVADYAEPETVKQQIQTFISQNPPIHI
ncbi:MAG: SDR family NAD(P)-dependent oxidoreductase, partial [Sphingobacteriales bacterium]